MKSRSLVFVAIATLAGAGALSCASQSAATSAPAEHTASAAEAPQSGAASAPAAHPPPAGEPAAAPAVVGPPQVAWKDMTKEQRGKYMGMVVLPKMREVFRAFDGEKFASIGCGTCHGKDARSRGFEMPNPDLYQLPNSQEEWGKLMKEKPEMLRFMGEKVKPEMAALLGVPSMDPQNPQPGALGCGACHATKK